VSVFNESSNHPVEPDVILIVWLPGLVFIDVANVDVDVSEFAET
jgi:hypothetical protein